MQEFANKEKPTKNIKIQWYQETILQKKKNSRNRAKRETNIKVTVKQYNHYDFSFSQEHSGTVKLIVRFSVK